MKPKRAFVPHAPVHSELDALVAAEPRPTQGTAIEKKNYAERLSRALAIRFANALRVIFPGVTPDEEGRRQETKARARKSYKKLDVGYSTTELGLALGVSIKTLNFPDGASRRFTKNYSRIDAELRAEATDYHERQPFAVLVGVVYLPIESCDDANRGARTESGISSFGAAVKFFRDRAGREVPGGPPARFERFFVALYEPDGERKGHTTYFDVMAAPPKARRPREGEGLAFEQVIAEIQRTYDQINNPPFEWAE
jgi:hypothetical protein